MKNDHVFLFPFFPATGVFGDIVDVEPIAGPFDTVGEAMAYASRHDIKNYVAKAQTSLPVGLSR